MNDAALDPSHPTSAVEKYRCGTLRYTVFGLVMLFVWLLWGDFIFTLIDGAVPGILPQKVQQMGAGDTLNNVLNRSLGSAIIFLLALPVGVASDRHRGPRGRRIPFLLWSTPFVGLFMILLGCHENIVNLLLGQRQYIHLHIPMLSWNPIISRGGISLFIFGVVYVGFDLANVFVNTIYWYLFNDVVPPQFLSRFMSLFRVTAAAASMVYNGFVYQHALDHFRMIFVVAGIVYVIGFMAMCFFVREGEYPPPDRNPMRTTNIFASTYSLTRQIVVGSFSSSFYRCFFLMNSFLSLGDQVGNFQRLRDILSLHLSMAQIGRMNFLTAPVILTLQIPAGFLADKWGPLRVFVWARWIAFAGLFIQLIWLVKDFGVEGNLKLNYFLAFAFLPFNVLSDAAGIPMYMQVLPRDRYGQFCSANAMFKSLMNIFGAVAAGYFMETLARHETITQWHYRYVTVWIIVFQIPAQYFMMRLYREWKLRGGKLGFVAP